MHFNKDTWFLQKTVLLSESRLILVDKNSNIALSLLFELIQVVITFQFVSIKISWVLVNEAVIAFWGSLLKYTMSCWKLLRGKSFY